MQKFTSRVALLGAMFVLLGAVGSVSAQELLTNGNLDKTYAQEINPPAPGFFLAKPSTWVNLGSRTITGPYEDEMSSEPWAGPAPTPVTADGSGLPEPDGVGGPDAGLFFKPFSGNATDGAATGHLIQDVPGTAGTKYTLTGWAGAEANALMGNAVFAVEFLDASHNELPASGNELSLLPTLFVPNGQPFNYKQYTVEATAPAGTVFVRTRASMIDGLSNPSGGGQAFVVDDFSLVVPEPTSLGIISLGAVSLLARRRRNRLAWACEAGA